MILTGNKLQVGGVHADVSDNVELLAAEVKAKEEDLCTATLYMSPKTRPQEKNRYQKLTKDSKQCQTPVAKRRR